MVTQQRQQSRAGVLSPYLIEPGREAGGAIRLREPVYAATAVTRIFSESWQAGVAAKMAKSDFGWHTFSVHWSPVNISLTACTVLCLLRVVLWYEV